MGNLISPEMLADLLINIINIIVLFVITRFLVYKPVRKMIDKRKEKSLSAMTEAQKIKDEAMQIKSDYENKMADIDRICGEKEDISQQKAVDEAEKIITEARSEAEAIVKRAEKDAASRKEKILSEERNEIADMVIDISGKIIGRNVDDSDNRKIIDSFFGE